MKQIKIFFVILFIGLMIVLPSCRPEIEDSYPELDIYVYNFSQIFEYFWHGMNRNYLYWDSEPTTLWRPVFEKPDMSIVRSQINADSMSFWDAMYEHYKPKFAALGEPGKDSPGYDNAVRTARGYFTEMTYGLRDGLFQMVFSDGSVIRPSYIRKEASYIEEPFPGASGVFFYSDLSGLTETGADFDSIPADEGDYLDFILSEGDYTDQLAYFRTYNFIDNVIGKNYLDKPYDVIKEMPAGGNALKDPNFRLVRGTISHSDGGKILYLSYNYCLIFSLYNEIKDIYNKFLDDLDDPDVNVKGIIMDLRGNRSGSLYDINFFWGRMVDSSFAYSETRAKSGEGRQDYGLWIPNRIIPAPAGEAKLGNGNKNAKIVFLVDGGTASAAELMTMAAKVYKNAVVVGTNTMGAAGSSTDNGNNLNYNGGAFRMDHFIEYAGGAEVQNRSFADKKIYEGFGITPDILVEMTRTDWLNFYGQDGAPSPFTDKQLERAIKEIDPLRE